MIDLDQLRNSFIPCESCQERVNKAADELEAHREIVRLVWGEGESIYSDHINELVAQVK